jgi:hypothetical protein
MQTATLPFVGLKEQNDKVKESNTPTNRVDRETWHWAHTQ